MSTIATRDNLDALIEFNCPFTLDHRDDTGRVTFSRADEVWAPVVEFNVEHHLLIDGAVPHAMSTWEALAGHSNQHHYSGPVMHASEFIGGGMADYLLETADEHPVYVVTAVEVLDCDDDCDPDEHTPDDVSAGHWMHQPAGWCILRLREVEAPCKIERTSLGGGVICAECGSDCECVVCAL